MIISTNKDGSATWVSYTYFFGRALFMQASLQEYQIEPSWTDLLLECIDEGISPEEVRAFLYNCIKDSSQN